MPVSKTGATRVWFESSWDAQEEAGEDTPLRKGMAPRHPTGKVAPGELESTESVFFAKTYNSRSPAAVLSSVAVIPVIAAWFGTSAPVFTVYFPGA